MESSDWIRRWSLTMEFGDGSWRWSFTMEFGQRLTTDFGSGILAMDFGDGILQCNYARKFGNGIWWWNPVLEVGQRLTTEFGDGFRWWNFGDRFRWWNFGYETRKNILIQRDLKFVMGARGKARRSFIRRSKTSDFFLCRKRKNLPVSPTYWFASFWL